MRISLVSQVVIGCIVTRFLIGCEIKTIPIGPITCNTFDCSNRLVRIVIWSKTMGGNGLLRVKDN